MSSRCSSSSCLNGNCEGCKNGVKFCNDPRCYPDCPDCSDETSGSCVNRRDGLDWTLLAIIGGLSLLLLILLFFLWYRGLYFKKTKPQTVYTQIKQTPLVQSMPPQIEMTTAPSIGRVMRREPSMRRQNISINDRYSSNLAPQNINASLDASLNIPDVSEVPSVNNISMSENITTLPRIPSVSLESPGNVSVASAQTMSIPNFPELSTQGKIQGF